MSDESQGAADTPEDREPEEEARAEDEVREDPGGSAEGPSERDSAESAEETPEGDEEDTRRPISVRDLMPSPSTRPARRPPERTERRERGRGEPEEAGVEEEEEESESPDAVAAEAVEEEAVEAGEAGETGEPAGAASVPTPVRVAMDAPPPGDSRPAEELPSRRFEVDGREWIVRISGRTITGTRPDAGALLMHLSFFRPEEPEMPARRLVTVDRPLDAFYDEDLRELFERSLSTEAGSVGSG